MCRLILVACALLAILLGSLGFYKMPKLVQEKIEHRMQLKIGTKTFERFTRIPIALTVKFFLFNITNSEQVLAGLERPRFEEVGPFIYKQWRRRDIVDIIDNNRRIIYREYKTYYSAWPESAKYLDSLEIHEADELTPAPAQGIKKFFGLSSSATTTSRTGATDLYFTFVKDDSRKTRKNIMLNPNRHSVTMVNLPLLTVLNQLAQLEEGSLKRAMATRVVSRLIKEGQEQILITKPVNEILFDGYKVALMEAANDLISNTLGFNFEPPLPKNKFGFFYTKNNTWSKREAGEMTIFTGRNESMNDFMIVDNWNGLRELKVWPKSPETSNRCNEIRGTDGSQFHPGVTRDSVLDIFSPLICTSIFIKYREDTSVRDIPLLRFTTPADVFAAPKKNARNACYCTIQTPNAEIKKQRSPSSSENKLNHHQQHNSRLLKELENSFQQGPPLSASRQNQRARITDSRCYIDGLMDLSACQRGAPIAASGPHFYNADPMLAMAADLKPQKDLHETYLDIEPMTGAVFRAASRAQLNAYVEQAALEVVDSQLIGNMTAMVAPLLWLEEAAEIDTKSANEFKSQLLNTVNKARRTFIYAIALGVLILILVTVQYWYFTFYKINKKLKRGRSRSRFSVSSVRMERGEGRIQTENKEVADHQLTTHQRRPGSRKRYNLISASQMMLLSSETKPTAVASPSASTGNLAAGALAAAAVMGAVDAAVTANQRRQSRQNPGANSDHESDADEACTKNLVDNEWKPANQSMTSDETPSPNTSSS